MKKGFKVMISEQNKRLAKNTLLLYIRQLFSIVITLYTSRVVLQTLGVSDYGIYNVVGGVVGMVSFLNAALTSASQRFISFELGRKNYGRLSDVFSTSVVTHACLAVFVLILAETIGVWFLNNHLVIPDDRLNAANWVFQCAIFTTVITIFNVPYNSLLVAHERMGIYAYLAIANSVLKLLIVYLLLISPWDKLVTYSILGLLVQLSLQVVYMQYCRKHFEESRQLQKPSSELFSKMFSFAGWSVVGNLGFSFKDQASNIILNLFFGTAVNAARGVATQVNGIVYSFSTSFTMALNPQITKTYSSGRTEEMVKMVYAGCRLTPFFMGVMCVPLIVNMNQILHLWLGTVPEYTVEFMKLTMVSAMLGCLAAPISTALQATGRIKLFQIAISITLMCELPCAYLILKFGGLPYMAMIPTVVVTFLGVYVRFFILKRMVDSFNTLSFTLNVVIRDVMVLLISYLVSTLCYCTNDTFVALIYNVTIPILITGTCILCGGLNKNERMILFDKVKKTCIGIIRK